MKKIISLLCVLLSLLANAQNVGIGTTTPHSSAKLDVTDTTAGILVPRMTTEHRDAIASPAPGLLIFNITDSSFYFYYNGWKKLLDSTKGWSTAGNHISSDSTFIGTTNAATLRFRVNNTNAGQINPNTYGTAFGYWALDSVMGTARGNTAFGTSALKSVSKGWYNTGIGSFALVHDTTGGYNVALGAFSGVNLTSGQRNTFIGPFSGTDKPDLNFSTAIGYAATVSQDGSLVLGNKGTAVGVGQSKPSTSFSNIDSNMISSTGVGVNFGSLNWAMNQNGFAQALYNQHPGETSNGLAVKITGTYPTNSLLDLSTAPTHNTAGRPVMVVRGDGRIGIGTNNPGGFGNTSSRVEIASEDGGNSDLQLRLAGDGFPAISLWKSSGTLVNPTPVGGGQIISLLQAGYYIGNMYKTSAGINFLSAGTPNNNAPGVIQLYTRGNDGSTGNNTIFMNELGSVGVGTNAPKHRLDVAGNVRIADSLGIGVDLPTAPLQFTNALSNRKIVLYSNEQNPHQFYGFGVNPSELRYQSAANHVFYSALSNSSSAELFRVNANGRLGVGVVNPSCMLANTANNIIGTTGVGLGAGSLAWQMNEAGYVQGLYNANAAPSASGLAVKIAGNTANNYLLDLAVSSSQTSGGTSIMLVRGDGRVGIGTNAPSQALSVVGNITATGTITSSSDIRFKKDIEPVKGVLASLQELQPIYYQWKAEEYPLLHFGNKRQLGFSAQEVEGLFPEIVQTDTQGYKSLDYARLTPVLVEALKEQQVMIIEQGKTLQSLLGEVKALKEEMKKR